MKRAELLFSAILVPIDYLMVVLAGLLAYRIRFEAITDVRPVFYELPFAEYRNALLVVAVLWVAIFALSGLYAIAGTKRLPVELTKIFLACSTGVLLLIVIVFLQRELFSSRFIILAGWALSIVTVSIARMIVRAVQHVAFRRGVGVHQVVVFGDGSTTAEVLRAIGAQPNLGYRVVGTFSVATPETITRLESLARERHIDEILLADPNVDRATTNQLVEFAGDRGITFKYAADIFETSAIRLELAMIGGVPIIELKKTPLDGWGKILKRAFDIVASFLLLVLLSPVLLLVALAIKIDSPGPAIIRLVRIGERGRPFSVYKFRSMIKDAHLLKKDLAHLNERDGPLFKIKDDPRVTSVGRFIRHTSIDELPQFWNVLTGTMSLVGPRPHEPEEVEHYQRHHRKLLTVKPGISGMAQISGRSDLSFEEEVRLDVFYIENWSLWLDLQVLLRTVAVVVSAKSVS